MVSPSRCPPWQPERPGPTRREPRRAQRSYTTRRDTIIGSDSRLDSWKLYVEGNGQTIPFDDPVDLCIAARQQLEKSHSVADIATFWKRNEATFRELRDKRQELRADDGRHYADFLLSLYAAKLQSLALLDAGSVAASEVNRATGTVRRRGASLPIKKTQRLRNPDHLRSVRTKPCLICGRVPSHAHHIRFAQPSAIARKVSDQWTVPLCSIHHDAVHQRGDERAWWKQEKIDPMTEAERLWRKSAGTEHSERAQISKPLNSAASVPGGKEINN